MDYISKLMRGTTEAQSLPDDAAAFSESWGIIEVTQPTI